MFSEKQMQVLQFPFMNKYDAIICDGAVRSGKTSVMAFAFVLWAMDKFNECNFAFCGKTVKSAERNMIKELMKIKYMKDNYIMRYNSTDGVLTIKKGKKINYFYVFGGKDESSYMLIQGITLAGVFLDEVVLMPRSFTDQALARCSVEGSLTWFSCNPADPDNWFLKEWIKQAKEKNALHLHFNMDDNPSLSEKTKNKLKNSFSGVFYKRYILGLWVRAEGLVYQDFADNVGNYIYDEEPQNITHINIGVDFGGNKSKHTFVCVGYTRNFKDVVVLEDARIETNVSPTELDALYVKFVEMCYNKYKKPISSYMDSAEQVLIKGLKIASGRKGLVNNVLNARKSEILDRIQLVNKLMAQGRFHIMRRCQNVRKALENAVWDDKHADTRLDDGTTDIDTLDAMEYAIEPFTDYLLMTKGGM